MTSRILPRKPRLCIFSYGAFTPLVNAVVPEFADRADIHVQEVVLEEALRVGREIDQSHAHDVMISAGANAATQEKYAYLGDVTNALDATHPARVFAA